MNKIGSDLAMRFASVVVPGVAACSTFLVGLKFGISAPFAGAASMVTLCFTSNYFDKLEIEHKKAGRNQQTAKMNLSDIVSGDSSVSSIVADNKENKITLGFDISEYHKSFEKNGSVFIQKTLKDKMIELEFSDATLDTLYMKGSTGSIVAGSNISLSDNSGKVKVYCEEYGKDKKFVDEIDMSAKGSRSRLNSVISKFRDFKYDSLQCGVVNLSPDEKIKENEFVRK